MRKGVPIRARLCVSVTRADRWTGWPASGRVAIVAVRRLPLQRSLAALATAANRAWASARSGSLNSLARAAIAASSRARRSVSGWLVPSPAGRAGKSAAAGMSKVRVRRSSVSKLGARRHRARWRGALPRSGRSAARGRLGSARIADAERGCSDRPLSQAPSYNSQIPLSRYVNLPLWARSSRGGSAVECQPYFRRSLRSPMRAVADRPTRPPAIRGLRTCRSGHRRAGRR